MDVEQWDALRELGLTDNEVNVYLALLQTGSTTAGPLVQKTHLHRSRVYASLERLVEKGICASMLKGTRHYYEALPPRSLLDVVDEKRRKIESLIPALSALSGENTLKAGMYEGIRGFKAVREKLIASMKPGETWIIQGAPTVANERLEAWLWDFHVRRMKRGIRAKILYNADARKFGKRREKLEKTEVRYMKETFVTPSWVELYTDAILIGVLSEGMVSFVVQDRKVRDSFAAYFDILWKNASK